MSDKYICMKCKKTGNQTEIPYKILETINVDGIRFKGQICKECYDKFFGPAPNTTDNDKKES